MNAQAVATELVRQARNVQGHTSTAYSIFMQAISSTSSELETAEVVTKLLSKHLEKRETYNTNEYNLQKQVGGCLLGKDR